MNERGVAGRLERAGEVVLLFLKLGVTGFGGPAAHIAMMRDDVVRRRCWLSDQDFLDLLGATNLIPGPNSTEMAIHLGFRRAGWAGLLGGGVAFILPAFCIVLGLAWAYVEYGSRPQAEWLLYGIKPVVIAIVLQALVGLGRVALKGPLLVALSAAVLLLYLLGVNEVALLFGGAAAVLVVKGAGRLRAMSLPALAAPLFFLPAAGFASTTAANFSYREMFLVFLKVGAILYGSGYVLLAFLRADLVTRLGWLTEGQLLDAIAIGQVTPGPVFTTATFAGYLLGGWWGAVLATVAIFLPSFVFVAASYPFIPLLRRSALAGAFLDGVNAAALALMAGVTLRLGEAAIVDPLTAALTVAAVVTLIV